MREGVTTGEGTWARNVLTGRRELVWKYGDREEGLRVTGGRRAEGDEGKEAGGMRKRERTRPQ